MARCPDVLGTEFVEGDAALFGFRMRGSDFCSNSGQIDYAE